MNAPRTTPPTGGPATGRQATNACERGFTLLELVVVMGILSGFLLMLVQFVDTGVQLFDEGESAQAMADRAEAGRTALERELRSLQSGVPTLAPGAPTERLLAQHLPLGLPARAQAGAPHGILLRASVQLDPAVEQRLIEDRALVEAALELGADPDPRLVQERAAERTRHAALRGRGRIVLAMWPADEEAARLELRVVRLLPDQLLRVGDDLVDPFLVPVPGGAELPSLVLHAASEPLVDDVLWFDLRFWSQRTSGWEEKGNAGPEAVWDSARAGWLADPAFPPVFGLDRGPGSFEDRTDDVWPRAIRATLVLARPESQPPEGLLADELTAQDRTLVLVDGERFPGADDGGFVKVRGEWIRYASRQGDSLIGLVRGQRGTKAASHPRGVRVRVGRTVEFTVPMPGGKEDWNG